MFTLAFQEDVVSQLLLDIRFSRVIPLTDCAVILLFVLNKAFNDIYPESKIFVNYQLSNALYCDILSVPITDEIIEKLVSFYYKYNNYEWLIKASNINLFKTIKYYLLNGFENIKLNSIAFNEELFLY